MTVDIEKAFDPVNHLFFIISVLKRYGFEDDFINIKTLLESQESCVVTTAKTTRYFILERGTQ